VERHRVTVDPHVIETVDELFPEERTDFRPSRADFLALDLMEIADTFVEHWDELPLMSPLWTEYRRLITRGRQVPFVSVTGVLRPDGWIVLLNLAVDFEGLPDPEDTEE
jgi:hypothetical protein